MWLNKYTWRLWWYRELRMEMTMNLAAWKVLGYTTHDTIRAFFPPEQTSYKRKMQGLIKKGTSYGIMILDRFLSFSKLPPPGKDGKPFSLPDDVVLDILIRLPIEDIINCRMVCRRWMYLTSTPWFLGLRPVESLPIILLHYYFDGHLRLYSIDLTPEEPCIKTFDTKKLQLDRRPCYLGGMCDGLMLLWSGHLSSRILRLYIFNSLTGKKIKEVAVEGFFFCGFWFHPAKREYFILTACIPLQSRLSFQYKIFNIRGESKVVGSYRTFPSTDNVPMNINGSIYNLVKCLDPPTDFIMIFDIDSEKIEFKPHPHNHHCDHEEEDMCLLEVEGSSLGFAHVCPIHKNLYLWILADRATWHWIPRYILNLNWHPSMGAICTLSGMLKCEMLMHYDYRKLITFNLETRRVRKIDISIDCPKEVYYRFLIATTYSRSLVDLNRLASFI